MLWFGAVRLQNVYNYCGFALHASKKLIILWFLLGTTRFLVLSLILQRCFGSNAFSIGFHNVWRKARERKAGDTLTGSSFLLS